MFHKAACSKGKGSVVVFLENLLLFVEGQFNGFILRVAVRYLFPSGVLEIFFCIIIVASLGAAGFG